MEGELKRIGVLRKGNGETAFSIWLDGDLMDQLDGFRIVESKAGTGGERAEHNRDAGIPSDDPMTDAQKRYLFRLLADRGMQGEKAYSHLKNELGVETLAEITKAEASMAIDKMLKS